MATLAPKAMASVPYPHDGPEKHKSEEESKKEEQQKNIQGIHDLQVHIKLNRNELFFADQNRNEKGNAFEVRTFSRHFLKPLLFHGSRTIYAPDEAMAIIFGAVTGGCKACKEAGNHIKTALKNAFTNPTAYIFAAMVAACVLLYKLEGHAVTCWIQATFLGWADWNQNLNFGMRFLSICGMMALRLVLSNVLPFTSPAFAYLIAKSQPHGQQWAGTFYLLLCSMPSGAIVPFLDFLANPHMPMQLKAKLQECDRTKPDQYDDYFRATRMFAHITDHLPFSFWVRPYFMEPAFKSITLAAGRSFEEAPPGDNATREEIPIRSDTIEELNKTRHADASAGAVLAGHFMFWAGPATTMYQRLFVPDWWTCIFVQPIGLFEDVAVVLATWAGESASDQKQAELALYGFMLLCNVGNYLARDDGHGGMLPEHGIVGVLTLLVAIVRYVNGSFFHLDFHTVATNVTTTTGADIGSGAGMVLAAVNATTTTLAPSACPTSHSNIMVMGKTCAWVTVLAVLFHALAAFVCKRMQLTKAGETEGRESGASIQPLLAA